MARERGAARRTPTTRRTTTQAPTRPAERERRPAPAREAPPAGHQRRVLAAAGLAALLLLVGLFVALSHSSPHRTGTNGVALTGVLGEAGPGTQFCQPVDVLPAGTGALRLSVWPTTAAGAELRVSMRRGDAVLARSSATLDGAANDTIARVRPLARELTGVDVCFAATGEAGITVPGGPTPPGAQDMLIDGRAGEGSMRVDFLRGGDESWWSFAGTAMTRIGMGRGSLGGTWTAWLALLSMLAAVALAVRAVVRTIARDPAPAAEAAGDEAPARSPLRRVPALAWTVAAIAVLNAVAWSLVTPAFQVPDEQAHLAYAQQLAETGRPPVDRSRTVIAPELRAIMRDVRFGALDRRTYGATVTSPLQQRQLERDLDAGLSPLGNGDSGPANPEPPLYYAFEAVPYKLAFGASLLDRLALMRLLSALMAGVTALFAFLFIRECLPGRPWAWSVGGLGVAFVPLLGFVSGGVNPDALLFAVCAALFYCLARAFRRGLSPRLAVWIGVVLAVGMVAKINFYGLAPGAAIAVVLAARKSAGGWNRRTAELTGIALGVALVPFLLLSALDALVWDRALILARTPAEAPTDHGGLGGDFSYLWQVFFPRLPGQTPAFPWYPPYELLTKGFIGRFGWLSVLFPAWVYGVGTAVLGVVALLAVRSGVVERAQLRRRLPELVGYGAMAGGLLLLLGLVTLRGWAPGAPGALQGRYLLPLLALFGAVLALAARGAGERWGRAVGAVLVVVAIGWALFSQLLTVGFFYG